jgi:hypothetical protein
VTRDSDALARSNWEVITQDMQGRFPDACDVMHCTHWACGWIDHLMIDTQDSDAMRACVEWVNALADYPVADDEHFSETEWEEWEESWDSWGRSDVLHVLRELSPSCLLDEFGDVELSEEWEERFRSLFMDHMQYTGGNWYPEERLRECIGEELALWA